MNQREMITLMYVVAAVAIVSMIVGVVLAIANYSAAGAFSVTAACVAVLGTLAAVKHNNDKVDQ